ncbi:MULTISPECIES: hypothetical protein [Vibrio]|uniref:hypothetical protein n=1 Tax=Vibrio TaxID=662 RepID=UPI001CDC1386|nr:MULTISPECIES: hypothetical protein [Vibrio]MCA2455329.1 hypothetical protein [Vibrio alginolyticus]MCA2460551.1 hypothetical protein [Vibrio alginolyticus]MDW2266935.1 hypothetical protein [Vibrio sp. 1394]MDW2294228.1 hypothetical protein [Vibrio sp. 1404]
MSSNINLNQPKTLIFHPGIGKTATSAIQKVGLALPTSLSEQACFAPFGVHGNAHNLFASNHPDFKQDVFDKEWPKLLDFALSRDASTIVSSEFLIRDRPEHIKLLIDSALAKGLQVKVIIAVRDYTDYLISAFLQGVKVQWGIRNDDNIFSFCEREVENIRMNLLVDHWSRHAGDENVHIIDYDKHKDIIVEKFFSLFDLSIDNTKSNEKVNKSISVETVPFIRHFDRIVDFEPDERAEFIEYVSQFKFKPKHKQYVKNRVKNQIVSAKFEHDMNILTKRYKWV